MQAQDAVGDEHGQGQPRRGRDDPVRPGHRPGPRPLDLDDVGPVDLVHEEQPISSHAKRGGQGIPIPVDGLGLVADVAAEVESGVRRLAGARGASGERHLDARASVDAGDRRSPEEHRPNLTFPVSALRSVTEARLRWKGTQRPYGHGFGDECGPAQGLGPASGGHFEEVGHDQVASPRTYRRRLLGRQLLRVRRYRRRGCWAALTGW